MKKIINKARWIIKKPISISFALNIIILLLLNLLSYSKFACNIDIMMQSVISNIYGGQDASYAVFSNIFITKILKTLYESLPTLAWYTILQVLMCFVALTAIGQRYLSEKNSKMHTVIYIVFDVFVGFECYIYPSYVKSAFILCFAMVVQLTQILDVSKRNWTKLVGCLCGFLMSGMLSRLGFFLGVLIGGVYYVINCLYHRTFSKKSFIHILTVLIAIIGLGVLWGANDKIYAAHISNWKTIKEYRNAIEKVEVFGYPDLAEEQIQDLGITEDQYNVIQNYDEYMAVGTTGLERVKDISEEKVAWNADNIIKFFHTVPVRWIKVSFAYLLLVCVIFLWESDARDKKKKVIISLGWIFAFYLLAYMTGIWNSRMTHFMIFIPISYWLMCGIGDKFEVSVRESCVFLAVFAVVLYYNFSDQFISSVQSKSVEEALEQTMSDGGITAVNLNNFFGQFSAYEVYPKDLLMGKNMVIANGNYRIYDAFEPYLYKQELQDVPFIWYGNWMDMDTYLIE